ncbi:ABC transporter permease [Lichenicoccus sp.]|uniref:ABC transporter permease n=1 Tax=Lichenicoccus sp. TaxID=2781899 RepID=UPI003D127DDB
MSTLSTLLRRLIRQPWSWSFAAAIVVWLVAAAAAEQGAGGALTAALAFGTFYVIVGLGQMLVVTLGPGNVDLSIPSTIALAGVIAMKMMDGGNGGIALGILAALASGAAVGLANAGLVFLLRIPPIVATLSASFIVQSVAIEVGGGLLVKPPPALAWFSSAAPLGLPLAAFVALGLSLLAKLVLARTIFGRTVSAIGQNPRAARLAGLRVNRVAVATYALSGVLSAICGVLLASFSGGASLDMGVEYLLSSIAVVVIGGTSVNGGRASPAGVWGAALFLFLLVSMLNTLGFGAGTRMVLTGLVIIGVITAAGGERAAGL